MRVIGILLFLISINLFAGDVLVEPYDRNITIVGRANFQNKFPLFSHAGIQIKFFFKGRSLSIGLSDVSDGYPEHLNFYNVFADDSLIDVIEIKKFKKWYEVNHVFFNLKTEITIFKRTEAMCASGIFQGLKINKGAIISKVKLKSRKIEWIGDSFTAGYGNLVSNLPPPQGNPSTGFHAKNQDNSKAWGAITSKELGAEYMCTVFSGRGVYRNYDNSEKGTLPKMYNLVSPDQHNVKWNFSFYQPDLVVVNLGQNDFGPESYGSVIMTDSVRFTKSYLELLEMVKKKNPKAKILITIGGGLSDYFPRGLKCLSRSRVWLKKIAKNFNTVHPNSCETFELRTIQPPYGEDWHPTVSEHHDMADQALIAIKKYMNW